MCCSVQSLQANLQSVTGVCSITSEWSDWSDRSDGQTSGQIEPLVKVRSSVDVRPNLTARGPRPAARGPRLAGATGHFLPGVFRLTTASGRRTRVTFPPDFPPVSGQLLSISGDGKRSKGKEL